MKSLAPRLAFRQKALLPLTLACLALTAMHPFMSGRWPLTADGALHLYRLISLDHAVQGGILWPRFVPGMAYGYGAPFFNYYSPLSLYPLEVLHLLGLSFQSAWLAGMIFYTLVSALGAYLLGGSLAGGIGGIVAAGAYVYAPYWLYDGVLRGTTAEIASLALLPWVLWAFHRLAVHGRKRDYALAVISFALFIPMHNVITLHSAALLMILNAYLWWHSRDRRRVFIHLVSAFTLALGLTAFFWLPALAETDYVKINAITASLPDIDVTRNLTSLEAVFAPPLTADPTQLQPPVPISLGWPQIVLGLAALLNALPHAVNDADGKRLRGLVWLAFALLAGLVSMNTRASAAIWQLLPLIRYSQFPWRLLGPASLLLALLAGIGATAISRRIRSKAVRELWIAACLIVVMVYAIPWLYSPSLPAPAAGGIVDAQDFERQTGWIATSSFGEYLPRWSQQLPDSNRLIARYARSEVIPRLENPPGVIISQAEWGLTGARLAIQAQADTSLTFDWLYFPGWWARLDGGDLPLAPTEPEGLISARVPPGRHVLEIGLGMTRTQSVAALVSGASLLVLAGFLIVARPASAASPPAAPPNAARLAWVAGLGVALFLAKALVIDHAQTPLKRERFAGGVQSGLQTPLNASFDNQITLLGYDLDFQVRADEPARLNLYWRLNGERIAEDYSSIVRLRDLEGSIVAETGSFYPGGLATKNWLPGYYVQERLTLRLPLGAPPGDYTIEVGLFSSATQRSLDVVNAQGSPEDVKVVIGALHVARPARPVDAAGLGLESPLNVDFDAAVRLLGMEPLPEDGRVGEKLALALYWQALDKPEKDYRARIEWLTADGAVAASSPDFPLVVGYPTSSWETGDVWRGLHAPTIPGRLEAGAYTLAVQVVDSGGNTVGERAALQAVQVSTPARTFVVPPLPVEAGVRWENGIRLLGYDLSAADLSPGQNLSLVLFWQPQAEVLADLHVFVHLVGSGGRIIAQRDQVPVNWTRPVPGWALGEVLVDVYVLTIGSDTPPGSYALHIGWYDPLTEARVALDEGGDFWLLPQAVHID